MDEFPLQMALFQDRPYVIYCCINDVEQEWYELEESCVASISKERFYRYCIFRLHKIAFRRVVNNDGLCEIPIQPRKVLDV
mmetsp:Transcript_33433/g.75001  ORF Transcript_33433/g.75001 Transcript_33433/m.75001 type:complete len:81 (+) Transcript_33433:821-1063(+)